MRPEEVSRSYVAWLNDFEVTKFTEARHEEHTIATQKSYVSDLLSSDRDFLWGIYVSNDLIGTIKLGDICKIHKRAHVSFILGRKDFWSKGIMSRVLSGVEHYAGTVLGLKKLNAGYYRPNIGSARLFQKLGWEVEGVRRKDAVFGKTRTDVILVGKVL